MSRGACDRRRGRQGIECSSGTELGATSRVQWLVGTQLWAELRRIDMVPNGDYKVDCPVAQSRESPCEEIARLPVENGAEGEVDGCGCGSAKRSRRRA
jgi:hypothetical protein